MLTLAPEHSARPAHLPPETPPTRLSRCDRDVLGELRRLAAADARRETPPVSATQLAARLEMSNRKAQLSVARLRDAGLIVALGCDRAASNDERGMRYRVTASAGERGAESEAESKAGRGDDDRTGIAAGETPATPATAHVPRCSRREPLAATARASGEPGARRAPTLVERALAAWRAERHILEAEELARRVRELGAFRRALSELLGAECEIKVGIGDDGAPVATIEGLEFRGVVTWHDADRLTASVRLMRRCPRCAQMRASRELHSLADLGQALAGDARETTGEIRDDHLCPAFPEGDDRDRAPSAW